MTAASDSDDTPVSTRQAIRDGIDDAYARTNKAAHAAVDLTRDGLGQAREKASNAYATAREKAQTAGQSAAEGVGAHPITTVIGGLAIGAVLGALLPRTEPEAKAFGAMGQRLRSAADEAIEAAKGAGRDKLDELGLSPAHASDTVKSLLDGAIAAAGSAGAAALESAKKKPNS